MPSNIFSLRGSKEKSGLCYDGHARAVIVSMRVGSSMVWVCSAFCISFAVHFALWK